MSKSNSKRFVRAAWSLLFFQVIASAGAVAVTGYAMLSAQDHGPSQAEQATPAPAVATTTAAQSTDTPVTPTSAPPTPACSRDGGERFVQANAEWCDTGVDVVAGQLIQLHASGFWTDGEATPFDAGGREGAPSGVTLVGDAPIGALVGRIGTSDFVIGKQIRFVSPASGRLYLAMNDVRGQYGDNQGQQSVVIN